MKRSITWPLHLRSENSYRVIDRRAALANMALTKKTRNEAALILAALPKPPLYMSPEQPGGPPPANQIVVTITRISAGYLDDDGLRGGTTKALRDGIADWLGVDDRDSRVAWQYAQQGCPRKQWATRVEIEDLSPGADVVRILGNVPTRMSLVRSEGAPKRIALPEPPPREQGLVFTRPVLVQAPWDEPDVVTEHQIAGEPPLSLRMRVPARALTSGSCRLRPGTLVELFRGEVIDETLGPAWLYTAR